jgi:hypothetical protein
MVIIWAEQSRRRGTKASLMRNEKGSEETVSSDDWQEGQVQQKSGREAGEGSGVKKCMEGKAGQEGVHLCSRGQYPGMSLALHAHVRPGSTT